MSIFQGLHTLVFFKNLFHQKRKLFIVEKILFPEHTYISSAETSENIIAKLCHNYTSFVFSVTKSRFIVFAGTTRI